MTDHEGESNNLGLDGFLEMKERMRRPERRQNLFQIAWHLITTHELPWTDPFFLTQTNDHYAALENGKLDLDELNDPPVMP